MAHKLIDLYVCDRCGIQSNEQFSKDPYDYIEIEVKVPYHTFKWQHLCWECSKNTRQGLKMIGFDIG